MGKRGKADRRTVLLNYKLWLSSITGNGKIGDDTYNILNLIDQKGSLKAVADELKISYRKAWGHIDDAEKILGYDLTEKSRGGKEGGQSKLTLQGKKLLEAYNSLHKRFDETFEEAYTEFKSKISNNSK